jgi:hypothetical protein
MFDTTANKNAETETQVAKNAAEFAAQEADPESALANGLPSWNIDPPPVVVPRKVRVIRVT